MRKRLSAFFVFAVMIFLSILVLVPITIMLFDSVKTGSELSVNSWGFPKNPTFANYIDLINVNGGEIIHCFMNSVYISVTHTLLVLVVSSLAAFAFAKYHFRGRNMIFAALIATMMIPGEITMPSLFIMFSKVKLLNSYEIQIIPGIANVFAMFMIKQYMETLPDAIIESAKIDGASHLGIYHRIMIPLSAPAIGAMAILVFLGKWNDYLWPRTFLTKTEVMPIMVILPTLNTSPDGSVFIIRWEILLAGCTIVTIPIIIFFLLFQDTFMSGVTMGAVKE